MSDLVSICLVSAGCLFFLAGTTGLMRFPDVFTRLHALTKADNLGLGLIVMGLIAYDAHWLGALKLITVWLLAVLASASAAHIVARAALHSGARPWTRS